jgi:hypothetical protein
VEETTPKVEPTDLNSIATRKPTTFSPFAVASPCVAAARCAPTRPRRKKADDATCATRSASASTAAARPRSRRARDSYRPRGPFGAARLVKASRASQRV